MATVSSFLALKARNKCRNQPIYYRFRLTLLFRAFSALKTQSTDNPGALPQAVTFRAFGAGKLSFHTHSIADGSDVLPDTVYYVTISYLSPLFASLPAKELVEWNSDCNQRSEIDFPLSPECKMEDRL